MNKGLAIVLVEVRLLWAWSKRAKAATVTEPPLGKVPFDYGPILIPITSQPVRKVVECDAGQEINVEITLRGMGITVETSYEDMIQVMMPMNKIAEVAAIPGVRQVRDPQYAVPLGITMMVAGPSPGAPPPPPGMVYM